MKKLDLFQFVKFLPGENPQESRKRVRSSFRTLLDTQDEVSSNLIEIIAFCYTSVHFENDKISIDGFLDNEKLTQFKKACEMFWNEAESFYLERQNKRSEPCWLDMEVWEESRLDTKREEQGSKLLAKKNRPFTEGRKNGQYYHK